MMIIRISLFVLCVSAVLVYIKFANNFVRYCEMHTSMIKKGNTEFLYNSHSKARLLELNNLCSLYYRDYSSHPLMAKTIKRLNQFMEQAEESDFEAVINHVQKYDKSTIVFIFLGLSVVNFSLYALLLYFVFVILPEFLLVLLSGVLKNFLYTFFIVMVVEAALKVYFNFDTGLWYYSTVIADYLPWHQVRVYLMDAFDYILLLVDA